ncbi:MAG: NifU family protein [Candidatus Obscuribacterales bacterium]|nr:NifU family protein [Candidatus Obscuribacterales bacterium]
MAVQRYKIRVRAQMPSNNSVATEASLEKLISAIDALDAVVSEWGEHERLIVKTLRKAIDDLNKEAFARLIKTVKQNPEAMSALKEAMADEVVYSVFRHHGLIKPSLNERIEMALETIRPMLAGHGGNVELVSIDLPSTVVVRLIGACSGCPASELTLSEGVEKAIKEFCPEITEVTKAKGICSSVEGTAVNFISPFAKNQTKNWIYVANFDELPENDFIVREVDGQSILLAKTENNVVCYRNACAHLGMPLDSSMVTNGVLKCSYHAFEYLLKSGECLTVPEVQLQTHMVKVTDNRVEVCLS